MRTPRALRRLCEREVRTLELDLPFDAVQMCERYGERRGRPIAVLGHPLPAGVPNGVWLVGEDADYFFHQANTSQVHRDQIIIHEFGHLIAGHQLVEPAVAAPDDMPDEATSDALHRTCYDDEHEWEAEMIASIIMGWAAEANATAGTAARHSSLRGIQRALGGHSRWL
ncbi:hypothetical protein P0W64_22475 [Tsukamurella sp. 8F]|uniref:hypothetical protein n=1 Tax=unclassified Tsukamurella TaxID=2633480 RepID=UPI0023B9C315|nr:MULTISPECIES: hypothetical protein [unclassified Tsukamurella]MDF0532573.1 hypothetical protein [Tsukamurella sp. 8J]MDF0589554.1 hypothetical protein [Tsukamurella sp. 8F]